MFNDYEVQSITMRDSSEKKKEEKKINNELQYFWVNYCITRQQRIKKH